MIQRTAFSGKIIILNAPPNAGKDTIAEYILDTFYTQHITFKQKLIRIAATIAGVSFLELKTLNDNRETKETKNPLLFNMSPRELLIHVSEKMIKPSFGKNYFGDAAAKSINPRALKEVGYVFSDGGFDTEIEVLAKQFPNQVYVIRFSREGCDFSNDSRNYISSEMPWAHVSPILENNGTLEDFVEKVLEYFGQIEVNKKTGDITVDYGRKMNEVYLYDVQKESWADERAQEVETMQYLLDFYFKKSEILEVYELHICTVRVIARSFGEYLRELGKNDLFPIYLKLLSLFEKDGATFLHVTHAKR